MQKRNLRFIVFSASDDSTIKTSLGKPEYSYYFVRKGIVSALSELGEIVEVSDPATEVDPVYKQSEREGVTCLFFSFTPPNKTQLELECPTIPVFAWEFDSLPSSDYGMEGKEDWINVLSMLGQAVCLSSHTKNVVNSELGERFPVAAVPIPFDPVPETDIPEHSETQFENEGKKIAVRGTVIDTERYDVGIEAIRIEDSFNRLPSPIWGGEPFEIDFSRNSEVPALLCGFYDPEVWGAWSCLSEVSVLLPVSVSGSFEIEIRFMAYGSNVGRTVDVEIGGHSVELYLDSDINNTILDFQLNENPANLITFKNLDAKSYPNNPDPRSMAIGIMKLVIRPKMPCPEIGSEEKIPGYVDAGEIGITINGVVYSSVLSPNCGRKNWRDMITAFVWAFRETFDVTLILKVSAQNRADYFNDFHRLLHELSPFKCRIVLIDGFLESDSYQKLMNLTDFYVNSSRAEGLCIPLMEFMANRKPVISPCHTALEDYVSEANGLIVESSRELTQWPHNLDGKYCATRYRLNWQSLNEAFSESYRIISHDPERYRLLGKSAYESIMHFAGKDVVISKLMDFIDSVMAQSENNVLDCNP